MVTIDLEDISVAGHTPDTLLPLIVFGANRTAIRDVVVNGKTILQNGRHPLEEEIVSRYQQVYRRVWGESPQMGVSGERGDRSPFELDPNPIRFRNAQPSHNRLCELGIDGSRMDDARNDIH